MTNVFTSAELKATELKANLLQIINEQNLLRVELMHAKSAIIELENRNKEYHDLLFKALMQLEACKLKPKHTTPRPHKKFN